MHRRDLLNRLDRHAPSDDREAAMTERLRAFVRREPRCFDRSLAEGHVTASALVVSPDGGSVLLTHHRKLDRWLQLGGHADGDPDVLRVALREAREESGIEHIEPLSREIIDVDVHEIPTYREVKAHLHYDVRFLLGVTRQADYRISGESIDLRWVSPAECGTLETDESVKRLFRKWLASPWSPLSVLDDARGRA